MSYPNMQLISLLLLCFPLLTLSAAEKVQVHTPNGPIVGEQIVVDNAQRLSRFLGIPYGQPPVGKLRFRRARPVGKWQRPIKALKWPNRCVQNVKHPFNAISEPFQLNKNTSEDCLYLNIWSPNVNVQDDTKLRPVIVYIHGGMLIVGSSSDELYNGETLAAHADAIVVTINYRLSTLGFLYSDEVNDVKGLSISAKSYLIVSLKGNQGLWDQTLALEWIQENIRYFGGNPLAVTIMGESAGAKAVSILILSPVSRGLFQNAIMMSGAPMTDKVVNRPDQLVEKFLTGIRKVGCATATDTKISAKVIECLEGLDAATVDQVLYLIDRDPSDIPPLFAIDGQFLPAPVIEMLAKGDFKPDLSLLLSTVEDEGSSFLQQASPYFRKHNPKPITLQQAKDFLKHLLEVNILHQPVASDLINAVYFHGLNAQYDSEDTFRKRVGIAFGDCYITCQTMEFARRLFSARPNSVKVYQWHYRAKLGNEKMLCAKWAGTCHLDDVYPALGIAFRQPESYHDRERDIAREIMRMIGSFARTGTPGSEHQEWPSYFLANDGNHLIAPYYEIGNEHRNPESIKFNLKQLECDAIWNRYIYNGAEKYTDSSSFNRRSGGGRSRSNPTIKSNSTTRPRFLFNSWRT